MRGTLMAMVTAVFVASGIKDIMVEEWGPAVLKFIVAGQVWVIEFMAFKVAKYRHMLEDIHGGLEAIANALENGSDDENR